MASTRRLFAVVLLCASACGGPTAKFQPPRPSRPIVASPPKVAEPIQRTAEPPQTIVAAPAIAPATAPVKAPVEPVSSKPIPEATPLANSETCVPVVEREFSAKVVGVTDGDTIRTLTDDHKAIVVRLEGIDAPEKGQEHGSKATDALKKLIAGHQVTIRVTGKDKYGRTLGFVVLAGDEINQRLVEDGWAWHFKKYNCESRFDVAESKAREQRLGLWQHDRPMAPWDYRQLKETAKVVKPEVKTEPPPKSTPAPVARSTAQPSPAKSSGGSYWLNTGTGVRHNSGCKHYGNTKKGRSCGPNEGKACGICGG